MKLDKYLNDGSKKFKIKDFKTKDKGEFNSREEAVGEFVQNLNEINRLQQKLYSEREEGVIFIFQAMDAAGKDGVIRTVFSTLSPHGVKEYCFKAPSAEELTHDYLWRFWPALPPKGGISIFNRSYYEDVLIGKVHELYKNQRFADRIDKNEIIDRRYKEIKSFEKYLYDNSIRVVKIFLNVSKEEQAKRFISRIDTPEKHWKISEGDIREREYWDEYQEAFETAINKTSTKNSPWYIVPADKKWYARLIVSRIVLKTLQDMNPSFAEIDPRELERVMEYREKLVKSLPKKDQEKLELPDDSLFFDTKSIVTDNIIQSEEAKAAEKAVEEIVENVEDEGSEPSVVIDGKRITEEDLKRVFGDEYDVPDGDEIEVPFVCNGVGFVEKVPVESEENNKNDEKDSAFSKALKGSKVYLKEQGFIKEENSVPGVSDADVANASKPDSEFLSEVVAAVNKEQNSNLNNEQKEDAEVNHLTESDKEGNKQDDVEKLSDNKIKTDDTDEPEL